MLDGIQSPLDGFLSPFGVAGDPLLALFSGGADGVLLRPGPGAWFTDTGGTTPASVGDPVAYVTDESGNANHFTQATLASRPIARQSGSLYYLEFDAVDDVMSGPASALSVSSTCMGVDIKSTSDTSCGFFTEIGFGTGLAFGFTRNGAANAFDDQLNDVYGYQSAIFVDQVLTTTYTPNTPIVAYGDTRNYGGARLEQFSTGGRIGQDRAIGGRFAHMNLYGLISLDYRNAQTQATMETEMAKLAGVTL